MSTVKRIFIPGSEWIYFKIYAGSKTLDNILLYDITFIVNKLYKLSMIEKWFFIRYADPDSHIRLRFLVKDQKNVGDLIALVNKRLECLVCSNFVWKVQLDTYKRELERYGQDLISETESIFCKDSECILDILKCLKIMQNENYRWRIGLIMIDSLLSDFSYNLQAKKQLIEFVSNSFMSEFGFNKFNSKQFNSKYRNSKIVIESTLNVNKKEDELEKLSLYVNSRSEKLQPIIKKIQSKLQKKENSIINGLLMSYIHMTINRLFMSKNRVHELVLYDFLRRYYLSEIAKNKFMVNNT